MLRIRRSVVVLFAVALSPATAALAAPPPTPGFATPTPATPIRPGFEPDVAVDHSPKTAGQIYTTFPFGFSTTQSFIFRSNDGGQSFHLAEGNFLGKAATCVGGGDSEIKIDALTGEIYFSDLQGLTNFSNSTSTDSGRTWQTTCTAVNAVGVDRQWIGVDNVGGTKAVGAGADDGRLYEDYDNVEQNTDSNPDNLLGNQIVMNESLDGIHYGAKCQAAGVPCPLPPAVISRDEGIPGNMLVDNTNGPFQHTVYAVHTGTANESVIVSRCRGKAGDTTAAQVADDCTDPTQVDPTDSGHVNVNWHDSSPRAQGSHLTGNLFPSMAIDQAGNLYVVWAEYPVDKDGNENGPGTIKLAVSTDGAKTWSGPYDVSPAALGNNVMPWVTAGSPGRIGIAWYGAEQAEEAGKFGPDQLNHGVWNVYYAQSVDALAAGGPTFALAKVSDHPAKFGNISTQGLGGSPDRSLGDFMQVQTGVNGEAVISYVDDTSADRNPDYCQGCGQSPPEAAGPVMVVRQTAGQSLYAGAGDLGGGPLPFGGTDDATGGYPDAFYSSAGSDTNATKNLDITSVSVDQPDATHVRIAMSTADPSLAADLSTDPSLGGPVGNWIVRWAAPTYDKAGDGNQFYVGMQAGQGGAPQFYTGTTCAIGTTHAKYFTYPTTTAVPGSISGGTITWTVPLSAIGSPALGQSMFSVTGMTVTQALPSSSAGNSGCPEVVTGEGDENVPNVIDSSPPFTYTNGGLACAPATVQGFRLFRSSQTVPDGSPCGASGGGGVSGGGVVSGGGASAANPPGTKCAASVGFRSTSVRRAGRGLRIGFTRAVRRPVTVDVFQVSHGRRVLGNRLVARFSGRTRSFTWHGHANRRGRHVTDGFYFVRFAMALPGGRHDDRRTTELRSHGRFHARPSFYRRLSCGEITSFKLERPAFGGSHNRAVDVSYRLRDSARVTVVVLHRGRVVRRWADVASAQHRTYRRRIAAERLPRGDYQVRVQAVEGGRTTTATLTTRRI